MLKTFFGRSLAINVKSTLLLRTVIAMDSKYSNSFHGLSWIAVLIFINHIERSSNYQLCMKKFKFASENPNNNTYMRKKKLAIFMQIHYFSIHLYDKIYTISHFVYKRKIQSLMFQYKCIKYLAYTRYRSLDVTMKMF